MTVPACCGCGGVTIDGLKFDAVSICTVCESKLLSSQAGKSDYEYWISVCRKLWTKFQ